MGCTIALRKQRDRFAGGTVESGCGIEGTLTFSKSEITVLSDRILVLERIHTKSPLSRKSPKGATEFVRVTTDSR